MSATSAERRREAPTWRARAFFLLRSLPALAAVLGVGSYLGERFHLGIDDQKELCLPGQHRWFVIDRHDPNVWRGDLVAFHADARMSPWFPVGRVVVKIVTGVAGDRIVVRSDRTLVNGQSVAEDLSLADKLGRPQGFYLRNDTVPGGALWVTGTNPKSFDSRYWGFVYEEQIIGRTYALPF
jgi:conjugal transfer pilin signal peptidase TrbI